MLEVEQGEVIVRAGEVITQQEFLLLDYFSPSRREINWLGLTQRSCDCGCWLLAVKTAVLCKVTNAITYCVAAYPSTPLLVAGCVLYQPAGNWFIIGSFYGSPCRDHGCTCCELAWKLAGSSYWLAAGGLGQLDGGTNAIT